MAGINHLVLTLIAGGVLAFAPMLFAYLSRKIFNNFWALFWIAVVSTFAIWFEVIGWLAILPTFVVAFNYSKLWQE